MEFGRARLEHRRPRSENRSWEGLREGTTRAAKNGREMEWRTEAERGGTIRSWSQETESWERGSD